MRDHPRVCGEKCGPLRWGPEMPGSPPRMRGKASRGGLILKDDGITPAYAGKSIQTFQFVQYHRDHPRVCGEKLSISSAHISQTGSPPRMRGKVATKTACLAISGITPAYAGKSIFCISGAQRRRDHPRVCGEKSKTALSYDSIRGSPPRMRGKGSNFVQIETFAGITPAYAGKRGKPMHAASEMWDHPRVCGEKARTSAPRLPATGSPPRMRGKGTAPRHLVQCCRITPAYAGKSFNGSFLSFLFEDHPRVCGEKLKRLRKNYEKPGSPPRMRGKDDRRRMSASEQRITPAYAGKRPIYWRH